VYRQWQAAGATQATSGATALKPAPAVPAPGGNGQFDADAIRARLAQRGVLRQAPAAPQQTRIVIYGAGLGAKQLLEITQRLDDISVVGLIDDNPALLGAVLGGVSVLGGFDTLRQLVTNGEIGAVALSFHSEVRKKLHQRLRAELGSGLRIVPLVDPRAMVSNDITLGDGALVEAGAVIGPGTVVGEGTIVDVGAVVAHDCHLGPFSHLSPGCVLSGVVNLTENVLVGVGAALNSTVTVGRNVLITPGAAVMNDVPDDVVVAGVPAKVIGASRRGA
jgi:sugar O-acyltransferase (sialic acid O-acetyltransferase NeuD family)